MNKISLYLFTFDT